MGHEDADAIASRLGRLDGRGDLVLIRDVACEQQRLSLGGQVAHLIGITCDHNRAIAALKHRLGEFAAEAGRAARINHTGRSGVGDVRCVIAIGVSPWRC